MDHHKGRCRHQQSPPTGAETSALGSAKSTGLSRTSMLRGSVGQTGTQRPQPVQAAASTVGDVPWYSGENTIEFGVVGQASKQRVQCSLPCAMQVCSMM